MSKRRIIWHWLEQGLVEDVNHEKILHAGGVLPDKNQWRKFVEQILLWLGALAMVIAVLFFIAFNWDAMGRYLKFLLVEGLIVLVLVLHYRYLDKENIYKVSLAGASVLLGVLLALYGQTYQTGADPWQLFAYWALLILPWVLLARLPALWILWVVLINLSVILYASVFFGLFRFLDRAGEDVLLLLFCVNGLFWLLWETFSRYFIWLRERWAVRLIAVGAACAITTAVLIVITSEGSWLTALLFVLWLAALIYVYQFVRVDLFILALVCLCASTAITVLLARLLFKEYDFDEGAFFVLTFLVVGLVTASALWLKKVQKGVQHAG